MITSHHRFILAASVLLFASIAQAQDFQKWGDETLVMIQHDFHETPDLWAAGVQLSSLTAAAKIDRKYLHDAEHYASWMISYFGKPNDLTKGLAAKAHGGHFYDDNEWVVLDLLELHQLTGEPGYLKQATEIFQFIRGGEDTTFGGGIWWQHKHDGKNTCSNAPAIVCALELHQITHDELYLTFAKRIYAWTNDHMLDADGLYWDHISLDGTIDKTKWSYNTALMIRANLLFAKALNDPKYLATAQRSGKAMIAHWITNDGAIADDAAFTNLMCGALVKLYQTDHDPAWRDAVIRAVTILHDKSKDTSGHYPMHWDQAATQPFDKPELMAQVSAARAYWEGCELSATPSTSP